LSNEVQYGCRDAVRNVEKDQLKTTPKKGLWMVTIPQWTGEEMRAAGLWIYYVSHNRLKEQARLQARR